MPLRARTGHAEVCWRVRVVLVRGVFERAGVRPLELDEDAREREGRD